MHLINRGHCKSLRFLYRGKPIVYPKENVTHGFIFLKITLSHNIRVILAGTPHGSI